MGGLDLLVSSWCENVKTLPPDYIMPPERRPENFSVCKEIPVIDLGELADGGEGRSNLLDRMMNASSEFGVFQVINHGISDEMMNEVSKLNLEFFKLPAEDRERFYCEDFFKILRLYTSGYDYYAETHHYWKDSFKLPCYPLEEHIHVWPEKPTRYREVVGTYSDEVRKLALRILDLICEGLGLEKGYFSEELSKMLGLVVNHYPPCPEPSLALGMGSHCDAYLITLIQQDAYGLQITKKDGEWVGIDAHPNAFVVMIANQLEVISNGKLRSCEHRGVTNSEVDRISVVSFLGPDTDNVIKPAKELVSAENPARYKSFKYLEFIKHYIDSLAKRDLTVETTMGPYYLQN